MVMVQLEQFQGIHGEAKKDGPAPNHLCDLMR